MPVMNGLDATAAIRKREKGGGAPGTPGRVPIIAMTAHATPSDRDSLHGGRHGRLSLQAGPPR